MFFLKQNTLSVRSKNRLMEYFARYHPNPSSLGGQPSQSLWLQRSQCDCCEQRHQRHHHHYDGAWAWAGGSVIPSDDGGKWRDARLGETLERDGGVTQESWESFKVRLGEAVNHGCFGGYYELVDLFFWLLVIAGTVAIEVLQVSGAFDLDDSDQEHEFENSTTSTPLPGSGGQQERRLLRVTHGYYSHDDYYYDTYHHNAATAIVQGLWWSFAVLVAVAYYIFKHRANRAADHAVEETVRIHGLGDGVSVRYVTAFTQCCRPKDTHPLRVVVVACKQATEVAPVVQASTGSSKDLPVAAHVIRVDRGAPMVAPAAGVSSSLSNTLPSAVIVPVATAEVASPTTDTGAAASEEGQEVQLPRAYEMSDEEKMSRWKLRVGLTSDNADIYP